MPPLNVGVIGCGYWGPNLVRTFLEIPEVSVVAVADRDLAEKPLTTEEETATALVELAEARDRVIMVGHIGAYNPAVTALKEMIDSGELGELRYIDAVRAGLGSFHPSLNVIWDLAPHDIAILLHVLGE